MVRLILTWAVYFVLNFIIYSRDFSNGFLVAEIFSWYYPDEIRISSFNTGQSLDSKMSNWALIKRVNKFWFWFLKEYSNYKSNKFQFVSNQKLTIPNEYIDETLHCKEGAAILLIESLFEILTNRP